MKNLSQVFNKEVESVLRYVKSKSSTYGEAKQLIKDLDWGSRDSLKSLVAQEVSRRLQEEIDKLPIQKQRMSQVKT